MVLVPFRGENQSLAPLDERGGSRLAALRHLRLLQFLLRQRNVLVGIAYCSLLFGAGVEPFCEAVVIGAASVWVDDR